MRSNLCKLCAFLYCVLTVIVFSPRMQGQQVGHYVQGAAGLTGSSEPPPGYYLTSLAYFNVVDSVVGPNGHSIGGRNHLTVSAYMAGITGVTHTKFLGADYAFSFLLPVMKQRISADILPSGGIAKWGVSDIYFSPLALAWHKSQTDILFNYGFYAPTGDYSSDRFFNTGLGMWTHQFQLGTTYFPDKVKKWNVSLLSTWEAHSTKAGTTIQPGPGMTLEYGLGRRLFHYLANIGVAGSYYRKLMLDSGTGLAFHDQENSIGPELTLVAPRAHLALLLRYEDQFEVRGRTSGQIFVASITWLGTDHQ